MKDEKVAYDNVTKQIWTADFGQWFTPCIAVENQMFPSSRLVFATDLEAFRSLGVIFSMLKYDVNWDGELSVEQ